MSVRSAALSAFALLIAAIPCAGQTPAAPVPAATAPASVSPEQARLLKSAEAFVRHFFGWAPDIKVTLGPLGPSVSPAFYVVPIQVTLGEQIQTGEVFVSKDGKTLLRGEMYDISADPFAANREKAHLEGNPSKGPADARVTLVEFSDFECPHCRELYEALKAVEARYPQVRIVYKDFPLTTIHPWAQTAALGGRCAFEQSPAAFWKVHDSIFDNQDVLSAENVWDKLVDFATQAGLNVDTFKACLSSPDAEKAVDANHADGVALDVSSTPTVYVNGRPLVGGDVETLDRFIDFELAAKN
ncbi:MAG: thioredoxin domain-containing protein [Candidatus Acidiferrales bacterium]